MNLFGQGIKLWMVLYSATSGESDIVCVTFPKIKNKNVLKKNVTSSFFIIALRQHSYHSAQTVHLQCMSARFWSYPANNYQMCMGLHLCLHLCQTRYLCSWSHCGYLSDGFPSRLHHSISGNKNENEWIMFVLQFAFCIILGQTI